MDLFPDGAPVRLRSRSCDLYLCADEDGIGVSLSPLRASARTCWDVRHVQRHDSVYVLLQSSAGGRYLDISTDPAPRGARGLRAVQSDLLGVVWSASLAGDSGSEVLIRHPVYGALCPVGCNSRVCVRQRVNGRSSLLARWSVEPAPVAPPPPPPVVPLSPAMEEARGGADQNGLELSGAPRAPARGRGRRGAKVWAPVLGVAGASQGPFWIPLVDAGSRHTDYMAHHAAVGLPHLAARGELEARLADLGGGGMIIVLPADDVVGLAAPARLWQKLRGRVGPGHRRSTSPRAAVFLPFRFEGGEPAAAGEILAEPEVLVANETLGVQAMVSRLQTLHQGMEVRHQTIRNHIGALRNIEMQARTGNYDSHTPIKKAVDAGEEEVAKLIDSYNIMKAQANELSVDIGTEGVTPPALPLALRDNPEDLVTPSLRRRLHRRGMKGKQILF